MTNSRFFAVTIVVFLLLLIGSYIEGVEIKAEMEDNPITGQNSILEEQEYLKTKIVGLEATLEGMNKQLGSLMDSLKILSDMKDGFDEEVGLLSKEINRLGRFSGHNRRQLELFGEKMNSVTDSLAIQIDLLSQDIEELKIASSSEIDRIDEVIARRQIYAVLVIVIFILLLIVVYLIINSKHLTDKGRLINEIEKARKDLQTEGISIDNKLVELLEKQFSLLNKQMKLLEKTDGKSKPDHTLALVIANEITRLENNLNRMDENVKGYKQLKAVVRRMKDNLKTNGYEIVDLLNKPYSEEMIIEATIIPDEVMERGKMIITKIIRPQVYYRDERIQVAQVEVTQGV